MAPLVLEGHTLGQRQRHYNKFVKAAAADQTTELLPLNYDDPDLDNLLRIDLASSRRNVEYVLDVLQSDDMLYVSRALKQSTWLITDDQYAHIINPEYLNSVLFPKMTTKAKNKLLLAIRLKLKNKSRVDEFFKYYSDDIGLAQKWLPNCTPVTIEKVLSEHAGVITEDTFKRLCENSFDVFKIFLKTKEHHSMYHMAASKILMKKYLKEYLELINSLETYHNRPSFGIRTTRLLMQNSQETVLKNFQKFSGSIHLPTFVKYLKNVDIEDFLATQAENKEMKHWITFGNVKHFIKYLPVATRFDFVKKLFIDKESRTPSNPIQYDSAIPVGMSRCCGKASGDMSNSTIYRWYRYAPFDVAFVDLKKLIRVESSPSERNAILTVLLNCARRNMDHVKKVLQLYREKHMNEPFKFKIQFVNTLLSQVKTYEFDVATWNILNDIFSSMEVYVESENSVPHCLKAIIAYKLLHNEDIPKLIEEKHVFDTFKDYKKKMCVTDHDKLFTYLYNLELKKLSKQTVNNEVEMTMALDLLRNMLFLLKDWDKQIVDFPIILDKIRNFIETKKEKSLKNDISYVLSVEKKWKRDLFEDTLLLQPNDINCIRALKHDPELLKRYSTDVAAMRFNDAISLKGTLHRLRIYWAQSLAEQWAELYLTDLNKPTGHKAVIEGIFIIFPRKQVLSVVQKYAPVETKIDWGNSDNTLLSLQKNIAKRMNLIRPSIDLDTVLAYTKGDYLQFALPSLNAVLYNMSANQVSKCIPILFDLPVSIKKHGLRLAYMKLKFSEIKDLLASTWKNTKNASIKTVLFKETYELIKKAKDDSAIQELWQLLSMFLDNLTPDENRLIYITLSKAHKVPLIVRPQFFMKSYSYLKSLPTKANCAPIMQRLERFAPQIMNLLDPSFIESILLKPIPELIKSLTENTDNSNRQLEDNITILTSYIIHSDTEEIQYAKYEKYLIPLIDACFESWKTTSTSGRRVVKNNCSILLKSLLENIKSRALKENEIYIKMYKDIASKLRQLPLVENYTFINYWTIGVLFVESLNRYLKDPSKSDFDVNSEQNAAMNIESSSYYGSKEDNDKWAKICIGVSSLFGKSIANYIKHEISVQEFSQTNYIHTSLNEVLNDLQYGIEGKLTTFKYMLNSEVPVTYIIALLGTRDLSYFKTEGFIINSKRDIYNAISLHPSDAVKICYYETMEHYPYEFAELN